MKIPEVIRIDVESSARHLAEMIGVFAELDLDIHALQSVAKCQKHTTWELTVELEPDQIDAVFAELEKKDFLTVLGTSDRVFKRHVGGKIRTVSTVSIESIEELRDVYTPGVARVCLAIRDDPEKAWHYTALRRTVAVVTNGTAILGLGDIGAVAGLPVMEGKAALFARLADISAVPILIEDHDADRIVDTVRAIAPSFGAIQLEDIRAPECFDIEERLIASVDRPVMHDDQHGTAVVALAALLSAAKAVDMNLTDAVVGQIGLGAAGIGICNLLSNYGVKQVVGSDLNADALARLESIGGHAAADLSDLMSRSDVVIATTGVKGLIKPEMVKQGQLILALSNPDPEIEPDVALANGACFAADGKSVNNVLGFPGLFKGALMAGAKKFTPKMLVAAAEAIHDKAPAGQLVPSALDRSVHDHVAERVSKVVDAGARLRPD